MLVRTQTLRLDSGAAAEVIDVTERVREFVAATGLRAGLVNLATRHTTSAIRIGEAEAGLHEDLFEFLAHLVPPGDGYLHDRQPVDGRHNAHSHIAALLFGASETVPVVNGVLQLGRWQRIFFLELDGPRRGREVLVTALGEAGGA